MAEIHAGRAFQNPNGIPSSSPALTRQRLRWVNAPPNSSTLKGLNQTVVSIDPTLSELLIRRSISQGSSFLATLGWMIESLQDSENARHRLDDSNPLGLV
jgi:hypothetical protein